MGKPQSFLTDEIYRARGVIYLRIFLNLNNILAHNATCSFYSFATLKTLCFLLSKSASTDEGTLFRFRRNSEIRIS